MFDETKNGIEKESVSKDSDTECVHLESSSDDDHTESSEEESQSPQEEDSEPVRRQSAREKRRPDFYGYRVTVADTSGDPTSIKEALASPDKAHWTKAME